MKIFIIYLQFILLFYCFCYIRKQKNRIDSLTKLIKSQTILKKNMRVFLWNLGWQSEKVNGSLHVLLKELYQFDTSEYLNKRKNHIMERLK